MNTQLRTTFIAVVILIAAVFVLMFGWNNSTFEDFTALNPVLTVVLVLLFLVFIGVIAWSLTKKWGSPTPVVAPPPAPPINWLLWGGVILGVIGIGVAWMYFELPPMYLIHLVALGLLLFGLFRSTTLSAYQPMTLGCTIGILVIGILIVPQDPLAGYVIVTGGLPLLLALGFVFTTPGSVSDRWLAAAAVMSAIFVAIYAVLSFADLPVGERVIFSLIGAGIFFALLPSVRSYLFPRATFTLTKREWWMVGILGFVVLLGIFVSFHGVPNFTTGLKVAVRWVFGSLGLIVLLVAIWSIDWIKLPVKIILTGVVAILLFWNFIVWVAQVIWMLLLSGQSIISSNGLLYAIFLILFVFLGWMLASYLKIWKAVGIAFLLLVFLFLFGTPFSSNQPNSGTENAPAIQWPSWGGNKQKDPGPGKDSSTIEVLPGDQRQWRRQIFS